MIGFLFVFYFLTTLIYIWEYCDFSSCGPWTRSLSPTWEHGKETEVERRAFVIRLIVMVTMSRLGLLLFFMCCSGLIFSSHCAGESLFDGFWDEGTKEDIDNSLPAVREVRDVEAEQEIDIQSEMLQRMADEEQLEVRSPLIGADALGKVKSGPLPHVMLQAFDTDGDGVLSPEERAKIDKKVRVLCSHLELLGSP